MGLYDTISAGERNWQTKWQYDGQREFDETQYLKVSFIRLEIGDEAPEGIVDGLYRACDSDVETFYEGLVSVVDGTIASVECVGQDPRLPRTDFFTSAFALGPVAEDLGDAD